MYILASILLVLAAGLIVVTWPEPSVHRAPASSGRPDLDAAASDPIVAVKEQIENKHPGTYFILAHRLFGMGEKDEAVVWFYVGLIRYRSYLAGPDGAGDAGEFASLWDMVERPINDHAFGDIPCLAAAIGRALVWDDVHADPYSPKGGQRHQVRSALRRMRAEMLARQDAFRPVRAGNAPQLSLCL
jgi:hypothetical protein